MADEKDPIARLREALDDLRSRRAGCPDPNCGLCQRFAREDVETDAALAQLETERFGLIHRAHDAETTVQNEHVLYRDAWERYEAAQARIRELESQLSALSALVYVPGMRRCAKCGLRAQLRNLGIKDGRVTDDNAPHDCPNDCGPMWPVTEQEERSRLLDEAEISALRAPETAPVDAELRDATLAEAIQFFRSYAFPGVDRDGIADSVLDAAEKWAALRLNTGPAPRTTRLLWVFEGELGPNGDYCTDHAPIGWLPLDALPEPPTEESDDAE